MRNPYDRQTVGGMREYTHRLLATQALGHPLPPGVVTHHHGKLVSNIIAICQDQAYHMLLHQRTRALAHGNVAYRKCKYCKQYDDPANMFVRKASAYHRDCQHEYKRALCSDITGAPQCLCGCHKPVARDKNNSTKWNTYIRGHNMVKKYVARDGECT
jgi:hypothetical protein